ncbi:MAG: primosomal protein N' [Oscillospiraceae bacterium]|nr:primosomal protein N' [Oscillospiraceae bacterium]MCL2278323.1 primosomal protein N' [Oscillospiraceae bacterium]
MTCKKNVMSHCVAKVAVSAATFHIDKPYNYLISPETADKIRPGVRVLVPFGMGDNKVEGVVLSTVAESSFDKLKCIDTVLDDEPIFSDENLRLALWMSDRFFCTVYDALRVMLPTKIDFKRKPKSRERGEYPQAEVELSPEQIKVFEGIFPLIGSNKPKAALLYGVTGSGKTIVYIKLIEAVLAAQKTAIVLVPEIALTPQTVFIFQSHFGDEVAVLHSALGAGERFTEWKRIRDGKVRVVVGTRSAVFAPLKDIGLIVIDEEQEHTYKSDSSPRYHAREIAKYRVTRTNGLLLLASATPSIESMYAAKTGKYSLFRLENRFNNQSLPSVFIVDLKKELKAGNGGSISSVLREELQKNLNNGEQSILFLNRRGASPIVTCGECGYTYKCRDCSVSMAYHATGRRLMCHYCGYYIHNPTVCPECSGKLNYIGIGTQKVESELKELFPDVSIIRMDADTTTRKDSHDKLLSAFREKKAEILIGTQMVTKGLDFENVTLVGVLSADLSLYISDYRAGEKTFSLITQVVGRSGRGEKPGRAVIQTFTPENKVITLAAQQDYDGFYENEIELRKALNSPPLTDLIGLSVIGTDEINVIKACAHLRMVLDVYFRNERGVKILGPAPAIVSKIKNKFRYKLVLNCKNSKKVRTTIAYIIREFSKIKGIKAITVYADVDIGD